MRGTIQRKYKYKETNMKFSKVMAAPVLTSGSETWPLQKKKVNEYSAPKEEQKVERPHKL